MNQASIPNILNRSLKPSQKRELLGLIETKRNRDRWRLNRFAYATEQLGVKAETLDWNLLPEYQNHKWDGTPNPLMEIIRSVEARQWVGVESATGVGKTYLGALLALSFFECYPGGIVVISAPKQDQLTLHAWKEITKLHDRLGWGTLGALKLQAIEGRDDWLIVGFIAGTRADEAELSASKARGFHAKDMLFILEETPGILQAVINAFEDTCTAENNIIVAFGNPDHQLDTLHRFCALPRVKHIRISAYDHPNIVLKNPNFIPGAATEKSIQEKIERYGEGNPLEQSRNRGICPAQSFDSLIRLEWCLAARDRILPKTGRRALGVDVANSVAGDKAALAEGVGPVLISVESFQCPNANQLGHQVARRMNEHHINDLAVDGIGIGAGTVNVLRDDYSMGLNDLTGGIVERLGEIETFSSLRSQMWWAMREALRTNQIQLPADEELFADLITPKWETRSGKICIQSKEELKKKLGRSPDKGDAAVYWNWIRTGSMHTIIAGEKDQYQITAGETARRTGAY